MECSSPPAAYLNRISPRNSIALGFKYSFPTSTLSGTFGKVVELFLVVFIVVGEPGGAFGLPSSSGFSLLPSPLLPPLMLSELPELPEPFLLISMANFPYPSWPLVPLPHVYNRPLSSIAIE